MTKVLFVAVMVIAVVASAWSDSPKDRYVVPLKDNVAVFENSAKAADGQPAFFVGTGDRLMIVGVKADRYKVLKTNGDIGWIDKSSVKEVRPGKVLMFGEADVLGYLDNPTPIYILDPADPFNNKIVLERSFARELQQNVDRITIDRIVGENPPDL